MHSCLSSFLTHQLGFSLGPYLLKNNVFVAPMAGVTDRPFRQLCKQLGAGYAVSEMAASDPKLWASEKTSRRTNHEGEMEPKAVQIAGDDPNQLADCARFNVDRGAQIIDINMGCPAKKVCQRWCGSALLQDELLVAKILAAVVAAVKVPVTLKFRTGWSRAHKNALEIAKIAQDSGIQMLVLHGRTREDKYHGNPDYETIAAVKAAVTIPVVANGDITDPVKAKQVLHYTKADAIMIGRAAQGRPWIFREIVHYLLTGNFLPPPLVLEVKTLLYEHLLAHYQFYGEHTGLLTARKHIGWYVNHLPNGLAFRQQMNQLSSCEKQLQAVNDFFEVQFTLGERLQYRL